MRIFGFNISVSKARVYEAADKGRRSKSFRFAGSTGVNREISGALVTLRNRSRHMVRNNGWAKRAVEAITKHTVGEGIQPAPIGDLSKTKKVKELWKLWADSTECDWYGKTTFYGLQELAMRAIVEGGDVIAIRRWVKSEDGSGIPLKIQLCEGDQIDHCRNGCNDKGIARLGVQYSKEGLLLGYWLFDYHPGDGAIFSLSNESNFFDKSDVLHAFEILRIGQARGVPFGLAAFMKMNDFSDYEDAQLVKQKISACFAAFVLGSEDKNTDPIENLEPGIIEHLSPEESMEFANPPSVSDYDAYAGRILQGIAAAYGITYEMLTMDYSKVNFTSGRMAKIDVTNNFKSWQYNLMVPQFCAPVWQWFINAGLVSGKLTSPILADWTAPRIQQLDPVKEITAQSTAVKNGFATISEIIRETGREPGEFFAEYAQDIERLKKMGITLASIIPTPDNLDNKSRNKKKQI